MRGTEVEENQTGDNNKGASPDPEDNSYEVPGWHAGLPDAYKGHPALKGMDVPGKLVEAYLAAQEKSSQYEGRSYIPGENASSEEWSAFRKAMGVPDNKDGYELKLPDDMDRSEMEGLAGWMKEVAFNEGLPIKATQRIFDKWVGDTRVGREETHKKQVAAKQERENALKEKYGEKWDTRVNSARDFVKRRLGDEVYNSMMEKNLLDDPAYLDSFGGLSDSLSEDNLPGSGSNTAGGAKHDGLSDMFPTMK
ncbi:MAG: hypothetical protein ACXQS5_06195 [Candidatus Methanospirareceae archaeon]|nr:MAG: hypothetical protein DRZ90_11620 [Spirochaetota bacterium]